MSCWWDAGEAIMKIVISLSSIQSLFWPKKKVWVSEWFTKAKAFFATDFPSSGLRSGKRGEEIYFFMNYESRLMLAKKILWPLVRNKLKSILSCRLLKTRDESGFSLKIKALLCSTQKYLILFEWRKSEPEWNSICW